MDNNLGLRVGQVISTMGRQITVPNWHEKWEVGKEMVRIADMPIIRLKGGYGAWRNEDWNINTSNFNQNGLVCFVPERYRGQAILSVKVVAVREKSIIAQPIEWIEVNPLLDDTHIGKNAQHIFDRYLGVVDEQVESKIRYCGVDNDDLDYRAIWHNKEEA